MFVVRSALRIWLVHGNTHSIVSSRVETLFYPSSFYTMLGRFDMIAWDSGSKRYFRLAKSASSKGAPKSRWGPNNVNNMGPHSNGGPKILCHLPSSMSHSGSENDGTERLPCSHSFSGGENANSERLPSSHSLSTRQCPNIPNVYLPHTAFLQVKTRVTVIYQPQCVIQEVETRLPNIYHAHTAFIGVKREYRTSAMLTQLFKKSKRE